MNKQDPTTLEHAPWRSTHWQGPAVEPRPDDPPAEWPADAVERVTFVPGAFDDLPPSEGATGALPFTEYFGPDGWPLTMPEEVKHRLTPSQRRRVLVAFHDRPWSATLAGQPPEAWMSRAREADSWLRAERLRWQVSVLATLQPVLPDPSPVARSASSADTAGGETIESQTKKE